MALELDNLFYQVDEQRITGYFDMDDLVSKCQVNIVVKAHNRPYYIYPKYKKVNLLPKVKTYCKNLFYNMSLSFLISTYKNKEHLLCKEVLL